MFRNGSILSFFRPSQTPSKRPAHEDSESNENLHTRRSKSPKLVSETSRNSTKIVGSGLCVEEVPPSHDADKEPVDEASSLTTLSDIEPLSPPQISEPQDSRPPQNASSRLSESFVSNASMSGSSQRVTRNGEEMIIDSDEGSDDSLEDIDALLGTSEPHPQDRNSSPATDPALPALSSARNTRSSKPAFASKAKPSVRKYKFSLDALSATIKKESSHDAEVQEALHAAAESDHNIASLNGSAIQEPKIDQRLLAKVMNEEEDPDNVTRVLKAVERTEALQGKQVWRFFTNRSQSVSPSTFPKKVGSTYRMFTGHSSDRNAAFLGGFMKEVALKRPLPANVINFVLEAAIFDTHCENLKAYFEVLEVQKEVPEECFNSIKVKKWLSILGVPKGLLEEDCVVELTPVSTKETDTASVTNWSVVKNLLQVIIRVSSATTLEVQKDLLKLLTKIALDVNVATDASLTMLVQESFTALAHSISDGEVTQALNGWMVYIYDHIEEPLLRSRLLQMLTVPSTRVCSARKILASAFLFEDKARITNRTKSGVMLPDIEAHLQSSRLALSPDTNYLRLGAMTSFLDVSIDDGNAPRELNTEMEKDYNKILDHLTTSVYLMHATIKDTGANHLARTEVKEALEMLQGRLEFAVRTRRKPKRDILGLKTNTKLEEFWGPKDNRSNDNEKDA